MGVLYRYMFFLSASKVNTVFVWYKSTVCKNINSNFNTLLNSLVQKSKINLHSIKCLSNSSLLLFQYHFNGWLLKMNVSSEYVERKYNICSVEILPLEEDKF